MKLPAIFIALLFAAAAFAQRGNAPAGPLPHMNKVKGDIYMIENDKADLAGIGAFGGNMTVYVTPDGVILVDSKNERVHDDVEAKVKSLTDKPIKYVILTHNHGDHAAGRPNSQPRAPRSSFRRPICSLWREPAMPGMGAPVGYYGRAEVELGGKKVELYEARGHTRGDTYVYFPPLSASFAEAISSSLRRICP